MECQAGLATVYLRLTLVYLMTHPKNLPNRSKWALLAFDAMHLEHTTMLKQQWMLFKL